MIGGVLSLAGCTLLWAGSPAEGPALPPGMLAPPPVHDEVSYPHGSFEELAAQRWDRSYSSVVNSRLWVGAEMLGWALQGCELPALVTSSPLGTAADLAGRLDQPSTSTLLGPDDVFDQMRPGGRLRAGLWWNPEHLHGIEGSYFAISGNDVNFTATGSGELILARPYREATSGQQSALLTAYPELLDGHIRVHADQEFSGAEALYRGVLLRRGFTQYELFAGYRYLRLFEKLETSESLASLDAASGFPAGALIDRSDLFQAANGFHGGQVGLQGTWRGTKGLSLVALGKVALGATSVQFDVDGSTTVSELNDANEYVVTQAHSGGLLAQPTNIGRHETSEFATVAELGLTLEYELAPEIRLQFGYTLIYWSQVIRALEHVDTTVNVSQLQSGVLSGPARPELEFSFDDFWAQGLRGGIEIDF